MAQQLLYRAQVVAGFQLIDPLQQPSQAIRPTQKGILPQKLLGFAEKSPIGSCDC
jgi:hypothetical protein